MEKDRRYGIVKNLIATGYIKSFREIFEAIPRTVVARDLGINNTRFSKLINSVENFSLKDIFLIADRIGIEEATLMNLVLQQRDEDKKKKK